MTRLGFGRKSGTDNPQSTAVFIVVHPVCFNMMLSVAGRRGGVQGGNQVGTTHNPHAALFNCHSAPCLLQREAACCWKGGEVEGKMDVTNTMKQAEKIIDLLTET